MSNLDASTTTELCVSEPTATPILEALPGRASEVAGLPVRRLLPRAARRLVGPWCFLDSYGPLTFGSGKPMDVAPHPHIGLQTVSWLLEGEIVHHDGLGFEGPANPGVLNLMTAGRGIAHAEETPRSNSGRLRGLQIWVALPAASRDTAPAFEQHRGLPVLRVAGGSATIVLGELGGVVSPGLAFSPLVGADVTGTAGRRLTLPLERHFEHALVPLEGDCRLDGQSLAIDTLYYLGCGREELTLDAVSERPRALLLGGAPFGESILMWWNFVARTTEEIVAARDDWESGRRFAEVSHRPAGAFRRRRSCRGLAGVDVPRRAIERPLEPGIAAIIEVMDEALPGADLVSKGLADLGHGTESVEALLVAIGAPRLRRLGYVVPEVFHDPEIRLYELLAASEPDSAHSRFNALVRRLVSFERSAECAR